VGSKPFGLVGVAGFEPAASSSRTSGTSGRLAVVRGLFGVLAVGLAVVRGRCCTPSLYFQRADPLRTKIVDRARALLCGKIA
jgi:hypothetical protein